MVLAERSPAQSSEVRGTSHRRCKPATGERISRVHRIHCWGPVAASRPDESAVSRARSLPDIRFGKHVSAVARSCNYHARVIRHILHLISTDLAQTLACSLILSRIDYCNALLHGAPASSIQKLEHVQSIAARIVLQVPRRSDSTPLLCQLQWLPVQQQITHKLAVLTADVQDPPHGDSCLPQPSHHNARPWAHSVFFYSSAAVRTILQDYFLKTSFPLQCSYHLELSAKHCDSN